MNDPISPPGSHRLDRPAEAPALYSQDGKGYEATVFAHYFLGGSDWLVTEYDPEDDLAFGWACINGDRQCAELGYTSLAELESVGVPLRVQDVATGTVMVSKALQRVERDAHWPAGLTLTEAVARLDQDSGRG